MLISEGIVVYKIVACDDEFFILDMLKKMMEDNYYAQSTITLCQNGFSLIDYVCEVAKGNVDIVMLDIDMDGENGIEIAELLKQRYPHLKIIFFTGHIEYVTDIFEADPCFFIVKPLEESRVVQAIDKAISLIQEDRQRCISIVTRGEIRNIQLTKIRYIENRNRTLIIKEQNLNFEVHMKIGKIEEQLPENFFRCHQSYIVNFNHVKELTSSGTLLYSGEFVPVSRSKYSATKTAFLHYLGEKV